MLLSRNHKKEKRYGPGPSNDYTSGTGKKQPFWKSNKGAKTTRDDQELGAFGAGEVGNGTSTANKKQPFWKRNKKTTRDAELGGAGAVGAGALIAEEKHRHKNARTSHETGVTGTTAAGSPVASYGGSNNKYANEPTIPREHYNNGAPEPVASTNSYQPYHQGALPSQPQTQVIHDPTPYAEVHHGGHPHAATHGEYSTTFGHGNY